MTLYQKLKWFILSGITETISETPQNRFKAPRPEVATPTQIPTQTPDKTSASFLEQARSLASSVKTLSELYAARSTFEGCSLKHSAHTLNGYGVPTPTVLCLMDTPNTDDEKGGKLLSGKTGDKFLKMLQSVDLDLSRNSYVSTLIPWRPPGNRKPTEIEFSLCRPFWEKEIALLKPSFLLIFGSATCQQVLGITAFIKACQSAHDFNGIPTFVCPTAEMIIKDPENYRRLAWKILQQLQGQMND